MTTPEHDRVTRPKAARTGPQRKPAAGPVPAPAPAPAAPPVPAPQPAPKPRKNVKDPEALIVNEAIAETVRTAYDVLSDTIGQGRKAAEQFRVGAYNVRDVPDDVRHMAANMLGLAKQLSSAAFEICETLLRQADTLMTPPPPGSTHVPPFPAAKPASPAPRSAGKAESQRAAAKAAPAAPVIHLHVKLEGKRGAKAHGTTLARPDAPTAAEQIGCDGLVRRGGNGPPITRITFETNPDGRGLDVLVIVPQDQPPGIYSGAVYCATQPVPLGQLVIEVS